MAKNIILCSDGTGNSADIGRGTNVFKLFEAVDLNGHRTNPDLDAQLAFYDDGVGTEGILLKRVFGGATGYGLKSNVKQLYRELTRVYDPGDHIFLFGFSRGAFTVRTLAGMIGACGILDAGRFVTATALRQAVDAAYRAYRAKYDSVVTRTVGSVFRRLDGKAAIAEFQEQYGPRLGCRIAFIGVWDTVDAVGLPFALTRFVNRVIYQFKFPTQELGPYVDRACHALSIDDPRVAFAPVLWTIPPGATDPRLEQVWFAGVHSNVGGGYPKQGLSLVALDWMLSHAARMDAAGTPDKGEPPRLRLQVLDHEMFRGHASVDDMLYDPRGGLGLFYRWAPRDIAAHCRAHGVAPRLHLTVAERIAHGTDDYAPGNLPPDSTLTFTPEGDPQKDELLERRARAVEKVFQAAHAGRTTPIMEDVRGVMYVGDFSYWLFALAWFLLISSLLSAAVAALRSSQPWTLGVLWSREGAAIATSVATFSAALVLSDWANRRITDAFTRFWHPHQQQLRKAMKDAHHRARMERKGVEHPAFRYY